MAANERRAKLIPNYVYFACFAILILVISIAPVQPNLWDTFPQTLFAICFATLIRAPWVVPYWIIAIIFLLRDILYFQPIGLETFFVLLLLNTVKNARRGLSETFFREWSSFALAVTMLYLCKVLALLLLITPEFELLVVTRSILASIVIYPIITGTLALVFGLVRQLPIERAI
ncbi:MAG: hypothetical protein AAF198_00825 [Pseudomonadota bacterium]